MEMIRKHQDKIITFAGWLALFLMFYYLSRLIPLAGDDWGYAVQGREGNPLALAFNFYFTWSGRFFSELWGFVVAPRKELWNVLNSLLFSGMFATIVSMFRKNKLAVACMTGVLMLTVQRVLRIETYHWIMGTTYVVPLCLSLVYFMLMKPVLLEDRQLSPLKLTGCILLNAYASLCMENMSAVLILANILMCIYAWFYKKDVFKKLLAITAVSVIGFVIMRASPGAAFRLKRDNTAFNELSLFEKIMTNWPYFLQYTFIDNVWMMRGLAGVMLLADMYLILDKKKNVKINGALALYHLAVLVVSFVHIKPFYDVFYSRSAIAFCSIFYLLYIVVIWIQLYQIEDNYLEGIFWLMLAGTGNMVMLISPIFGARSSLYTVYFIIVLCACVLNSIELKKPVYACLVIVCLGLCGLKVREFVTNANAIHAVEIDRQSKIAYYVDHPEDTAVYLPRMPEGIIHSCDIELDDDYHMNVFKQYFGLNPKAEIQFYRN